MKLSRRRLTRSLPALIALPAAGETTAMPSRTFKFEDLEARATGPGGVNRSRAVLDGKTRSGYSIEMHETELAPGMAPHAPHKHVHEEMVLLREGTMEVTIAGRVSTLGAGSVAYVSSNEEHGWRNVGSTRAHYFVLALGRETQA